MRFDFRCGFIIRAVVDHDDFDLAGVIGVEQGDSSVAAITLPSL